MNSRILSIGVFMVLMLSSLLAGRQGYFGAKEAITADLNQALMRTLEERQDNIVAQDSIRAYKQLREASDGPVWMACHCRPEAVPPPEERAAEGENFPLV